MRIAIVNDTMMIVEALRRILVSSGKFDIAWTATNGAEAVELSRQDTPDLVLMDIEMPVMNGVEATRQIMTDNPCAILIVTATVEHNAAQVFQCLGAGALDVVKLPSVSDNLDSRDSPLLAKIQVLRHLIKDGHNKFARKTLNAETPLCRQLVVMGASAGGPNAITEILSGLPANFAAGIVIVQHIDLKFAASLAHWLDDHSPLPVRLACQGESPQPGTVLLAGSGNHLRFLDATTLGYTREPEDCYYCPSIDVLFESAAQHWKRPVVGVLLTGMGRDGAKGLKALADTGAVTIAQDKTTSAVYGIPKAAAAIGAAKEILPLHEIAPRLMTLFPTSVPK
jgi:two-component system response regulator WspF